MPLDQKIMTKLGNMLVEHSHGKIVIVDDGGPCLQLNGERLGRNLDIYDFMAKVSPDQALPDFLANVLLPIKKELPDLYKKVSEELKKYGSEVYSGVALKQWKKLF